MTDIQAIKDRLDIAQILGEYIQLKKAGANWKANCPFHHEKSPSFMVHPEKQIWHCFGCFPKGTLIQTVKGLKEIQEIKKGEQVISHTGFERKVIRELVRPYDSEMVSVRVRKSNEEVKMTADHEVFVIRSKNCMQKGRLTRLCQMRCKQRCPQQYFKDYKIEKIRAGDLKKDDYLLYPVNKEVKDTDWLYPKEHINRKKSNLGPQIKKLPEKIHLNGDLLKLLGYWIAEGSNHRAYIRFSLGNHEQEFANEIVSLIKKVFGFSASIHNRKLNTKRTGLEITCCNSELSNLFENLCGKGAANKHIPFGWEKLPEYKQRIILDAIFRGDGHISKGGQKSRAGYKSIATISKLLSLQLKNILLRQNIIPSLHLTKAQVDKKGVKHRDAYNIFWFEDVQATYADWWIENGVRYAIYPITKLVKSHYKGTVYNLTVDKDHSYLTENFAVGNCGKGGDVFTFLQEMEGIDFPEALKILADRAGVKMDSYVSEINKSQKNRLLEINSKAAYFFHHFLLEMPAGQPARQYLENRKLKPEIIEEWQIGFIPEQWELLTQYLLKKGFGIDDLITSGLTIKKDGGGYYDRFRGRIMFPIWDAHGNCVGFTGRVLVETERSGGKYVNTPQSPVFDKSRLLYGLNKAKMEMKAKDLTVLVEGQMDVVACHQAGMKNVVAASGTALTFEQVKLLKRYSNNIAMAFDADAAGQNAAKRGIDIAMEQGMNIKIIKIPDGAGKDADECLKKNPEVWFKAVEGSKDVMEWYFNSAFAVVQENNPKQKQKIVEGLLPEIARLQYSTERDHWLRQLSGKLDVDIGVLREELHKYMNQPHQPGRENQAPKTRIAVFNPQNQGYIMRVESLWSLFIKFPKLIMANYSYLKKEYFAGTPYLPLYELIKEAYNPNIVTKKEIREILQEGGDLVNILLLKADKDFEGFEKDDADKEVTDLLEKIKSEWTKKRRKELNEELLRAQAEKNEARLSEILKEILNLN